MNVRLFISAAAALFAGCTGIYAQTSDVKLSSRYDEQHNLNINAEYSGYGSRTVYLRFSETRNCTPPGDLFFVIKSSGHILTLRPINNDSYPYANYSSWIIHGTLSPTHVDSLFTYRLPFSTAKTVKARYLRNVLDRFGGDNSENWHSLQFILDEGDTVYAARKGIVVRVVDSEEASTGRGEISLSSKYNYIHVEHRDGTIASYTVLKKGSIMVEEGDIVYPGTPLALAGSYDGIVFQTRFHVFYKIFKRTENPKYASQISATRYIDPYFATTQGNIRLIRNTAYTPIQTRELVTKEMTKREIKKLPH